MAPPDSEPSTLTLTLPRLDVGFLISGLGVLAEQWEETERVLRGGAPDLRPDAPAVREGHDPDEAAWLAAEYRTLMERIEAQRTRR